MLVLWPTELIAPVFLMLSGTSGLGKTGLERFNFACSVRANFRGNHRLNLIHGSGVQKT
jgi:hypothetical protein